MRGIQATARILNEMEADEAADVLGDISPERAAEALREMEEYLNSVNREGATSADPTALRRAFRRLPGIAQAERIVLVGAVDNTSGEDWKEVRVGVGSSSAMSFDPASARSWMFSSILSRS